jgi:thiamine-phosphate pyrophosphorylase
LEIDARAALADARLYLVCPLLSDATLRAALDGGVDIVQLRIKGGSDQEVVAAAQRYARICRERGVPLILNDRPDLVARAHADGVHLGQEDMPVADARAIIGEERIVGLSTHTPDQIDAAADQELDYIGVGPVHATPTKPGRPAVGVALVEYAAAHARVPFFAIGGLDEQRLDDVLRAGARRIAVVRAITAARDPRLAARKLRDLIERAAVVRNG